MKPEILFVFAACCMFAACTMPSPSLYVRNYSSSPLDIVVIFHGVIPDSAFRELSLIHGVAIERSIPIQQSKPTIEQLDVKSFKIGLPPASTLLLPDSRRYAERMFDSSTILLVKDHYLVDTLFHKTADRHLQKFKNERRFFFTHQMFYDYVGGK